MAEQDNEGIFDTEDSFSSPPQKAKVFVVNVGSHDLSDAKRFGDEVIGITYGHTNPFQVDDLTQMAAKAIKDSTEEDYLLLSGNRVLSTICSTLWLLKNQHVKFLIYNGKQRRYVQRDISLSHAQKLLNDAVDQSGV